MSVDRPVAGLVLAAGLSTRMGHSKMLLELGGRTVVERAVRCALDAGLSPVHVVVGHDAGRIAEALTGLPVTLVSNPDPARGIHTSLAVGVSSVDADAVVVLLGDMPLVTASMVRELVTRWRTTAAPLAVSLYGDVVAPPILYTAPLFPELDGEGCGKRVVKRHRAVALEVRWPETALTDLDEPADVVRAESLLVRA